MLQIHLSSSAGNDPERRVFPRLWPGAKRDFWLCIQRARAGDDGIGLVAQSQKMRMIGPATEGGEFAVSAGNFAISRHRHVDEHKGPLHVMSMASP